MRMKIIISVILAALLGFGSVSSAALLGMGKTIQLGFPQLLFDSGGTTAYDVATHVLSINASPVTLFLAEGVRRTVYPSGNPPSEVVSIRVHVDETGTLISGMPGDGLTVIGMVDIVGNGVAFAGVLLTGEVLEFGFQDTQGTDPTLTTDYLDFRIRVTGGLLASPDLYAGKNLGISVTIDRSTFSGLFTDGFSGGASGWLGAIPPLNTSIGGLVWNDLNADGVQEAGEPGLVVTVTLTGLGGPLTTTTGSDGIYTFTGLPAGNYTVCVDPTTLPANLSAKTFDLDGVSTPNCATVPLTAGQNRTDVAFGYQEPADPKLSLVKTASVDEANFGDKVTYTYKVTNTGNVTLADVTITDDNATPNYTGDDFIVGKVDLQEGETQTLSATTFPPANMCVAVSGQNLPIGTLIISQLANGNFKVTYLQSRSVIDNTYGVNAVGYPNGHSFSSLLRSDRAEFRFTNGSGAEVLAFFVDYISPSSNYPSGFGTSGVTGSNGWMITGSATNVVSVSTSLTTNLNQSPEFYGYTHNSPAPESLFPTWDYVSGYTVEVSGGGFGPSGFGVVTVSLVNNSPSKLGIKNLLPTPCDSFASNIATATSKFGDTLVTAAATETVHILGTPTTGGHFTTFTQGGWGSKPHGNNPAVLLQSHFPTVFPSEVTIGGHFTLKFTSQRAIQVFLPQGRRPGVLTKSATDPTGHTAAGEFAGQVLALQLNVSFSDAGITLGGLRDLRVASGELAGYTVAEVLSLANTVLGGNLGALPPGVSISDLNHVVTKINRNFESGSKNHGFLAP